MEYVRYGNNDYFLGLREKVRQVYEALCYKMFRHLKVLNDGEKDSGMAEYYRVNYSVYFSEKREVDPGPYLSTASMVIRLLLRESMFGR